MKKSCLKCKKKNRCPIDNGQKMRFYPGKDVKTNAKWCKYYEPAKS